MEFMRFVASLCAVLFLALFPLGAHILWPPEGSGLLTLALVFLTMFHIAVAVAVLFAVDEFMGGH